MKIPLTPAGIEPAIFRIVAHHLNHCATAVPPCGRMYNPQIDASVVLTWCVLSATFSSPVLLRALQCIS